MGFSFTKILIFPLASFSLSHHTDDEPTTATSSKSFDPIHYLGYGVKDFKDRRLEDRFYCDKSHLIHSLEMNDRFILCRPRRSGKTTFIAMLHEYYDWNNRNQKDFDKVAFFLFLFFLRLHKTHECTLSVASQLFKGLAIAKNRTFKQGKYIVLKLDFSGLMISSSENAKVVAESFDEEFNEMILSQVAQCAMKYNLLEYTSPSSGSGNAAVRNLQRAVGCLQRSIPNEADRPLGIYVFVDEFDALHQDRHWFHPFT